MLQFSYNNLFKFVIILFPFPSILLLPDVPSIRFELLHPCFAITCVVLHFWYTVKALNAARRPWQPLFGTSVAEDTLMLHAIAIPRWADGLEKPVAGDLLWHALLLFFAEMHVLEGLDLDDLLFDVSDVFPDPGAKGQESGVVGGYVEGGQERVQVFIG